MAMGLWQEHSGNGEHDFIFNLILAAARWWPKQLNEAWPGLNSKMFGL